MSDSLRPPPVTHIPTKLCSVCGIPALGGYEYCLAHTAELDELIGDSVAWAEGLRPYHIDKPRFRVCVE